MQSTNDAAAPLLVNRRQAARLLGVSVGTLDALVRRGELRPVRVGRRVLLSIEGLRRFIEARMEGAA